MRILQVISSGGMYGAESVILNLACTLMEDSHWCGIAVFANSANPDTQLFEKAAEEGIESFMIPCRGQWDRRAIARIRELAAETGAEIVHAHGYKADVYAYLALRDSNVPLASTCHTWYDNDLLVYLYGVLDRFVLRKYTQVVAVSQEVRCRLLKSGVGPRQITVIRNGIDLRPFIGDPARGWHELSDDHRAVVGLVGRLSTEKGVDIFLQAASHVLKKLPHVTFVVAGDGPDRQQLEALIDELQLRRNVSMRGRCDDMPSLYRSLDVMVSSSRKEGLPIAILEGMANGLPVIATAVGEVPTVIRDGETGILLPPGNPEKLATAIMELLRDYEKRRRLGNAARRLIENEYSAAQMTREYLRVYRTAALPIGHVQQDSPRNMADVSRKR